MAKHDNEFPHISQPADGPVPWKCSRKDKTPLALEGELCGPVEIVLIGQFAYDIYKEHLSRFGRFHDFDMEQVKPNEDICGR